MQRYFIEPEQFVENTVKVIGEDARHIIKVMRSKPGDQFIASDGASRVVLAEISSMDAQEVTADIIEHLGMSGEPWLSVTVAQSLPKGDKMETVIQKCTEIGATSFLPFLSHRTVVQYDHKKEEKRLARWRKIAKEAAEQAHRSVVPVLENPVTWKGLLGVMASYDLVCLCYEKEEGAQLRDVIAPFVRGLEADPQRTYRILVAVGPEGGLTENEVAQAEEAGAVSIGLGRRILRTETAAMAALTCIMYESGEMGGA